MRINCRSCANEQLVGFMGLSTEASLASGLIHSAAYPDRVKVSSATYHVGVETGASSLSEIHK
jgi:hypothetical protein